MGITKFHISWVRDVLYHSSPANGTKRAAIFSSFKAYFICIEVEAAILLSLDRSLGPQETLYLLVCGLSTENQIPGGQWSQEIFFGGICRRGIASGLLVDEVSMLR